MVCSIAVVVSARDYNKSNLIHAPLPLPLGRLSLITGECDIGDVIVKLIIYFACMVATGGAHCNLKETVHLWKIRIF